MEVIVNKFEKELLDYINQITSVRLRIK